MKELEKQTLETAEELLKDLKQLNIDWFKETCSYLTPYTKKLIDYKEFYESIKNIIKIVDSDRKNR